MPLRACLCAWVRPSVHRTRVALWQHPDEVSQAKNSARLLRLSLQPCEVHAPAELQAPLPAHWLGPGAALLYPADDVAPAPAWPVGTPPETLVVLDGTWRQSRQMLRAQPALMGLPRLALPQAVCDAHGAHYRVRKAHRPGQLSTLEAVCLALQQIEGQADTCAPLLQAFDGWVDEQLSRAGRA